MQDKKKQPKKKQQKHKQSGFRIIDNNAILVIFVFQFSNKNGFQWNV